METKFATLHLPGDAGHGRHAGAHRVGTVTCCIARPTAACNGGSGTYIARAIARAHISSGSANQREEKY
jgi:hypothetical protein